MRQGLALFMILALAGCASNRSGTATRSAASRPEYRDSLATTLVFAPPVALAEPPVYLWRDTRTPGAFVGFDELSATFYYIRQDDCQTSDLTDNVLRRSVSERVGVSYR
ncbi:MAG: hypothetical protein ACM359_22440 [Bacillota bacterium]